MKALRNGMKRFFQDNPDGGSQTRLWTTFKSSKDKLVDRNTGRFRSNFLQISSRATNEFRDRTDIAYMANRFVDPNIAKFFSTRDIEVDSDRFALSEMLQWIWRSAIRDNKPINLLLPSKRMKDLLMSWIEECGNGGAEHEQTA